MALYAVVDHRGVYRSLVLRRPDRRVSRPGEPGASGQARTVGRLPHSQRREAMAAELARHFGPKAASPEFYVDAEWSDRQWTRGCYNANHGPHVWTKYGPALTVPIGPHHARLIRA